MSKKAEFNTDFKSVEKVIKKYTYEISINSAFLLPLLFFRIFFGKCHNSTCNLWSRTRTKRLKTIEKRICVFEFNFAPIAGSVFFLFLKKSNLLYPKIGRQACRAQTGMHTERHTSMKTGKHAGRHTCRHASMHADTHACIQASMQGAGRHELSLLSFQHSACILNRYKHLFLIFFVWSSCWWMSYKLWA